MPPAGPGTGPTLAAGLPQTPAHATLCLKSADAPVKSVTSSVTTTRPRPNPLSKMGELRSHSLRPFWKGERAERIEVALFDAPAVNDDTPEQRWPEAAAEIEQVEG